MRETPELQPERELRLAVVMYGGVSLAIYMNGATQELLNLVRATARDPTKPDHARFTDEELGNSSALVYRRLARLTSASAQAADVRNPLAPVRQRFVVDILSGTSAGGINAVFLAKALANGQSVDGLARLWESEADIGLLINDSESLAGVPDLPKNQQPRSLLNSERMYRKLLDAFDGMDPKPPSEAEPALADEVDLFVTATDLQGLPVRLQLGGGEVAEERRYRKCFHLSYRQGRNDFEKVDNPFLAFISRCTSSFPVAFEPMQFAGAATLLRAMRRPIPHPGDPDIPDRWARHFDEYSATDQGPAAAGTRPFADGGYLDNKPFSYAIDAIGGRRGSDSGRVERKLVYIEPDPERLSLPPLDAATEAPNAVQNALAVIQLRSYETIREELLRLRDRNRLVDKIRSVVAGVDDDFEALGPVRRDTLADIIARRDEFGERALEHVVEIFGAAYGGYHRLKVGQLTDDLSQIVAQHAGISPASDEFRAIRLLVRAWRNARYCPNPPPPAPAPAPGAVPAVAAVPGPPARESEFKFLRAFDFGFRIRRINFVIDQINQYRVLTPQDLAEELAQHPSICGGLTAVAIAAERPDELGRAFDELRLGLAAAVRDLRTARDGLVTPEPDERLPEIAAKGEEIRNTAASIMVKPTDLQRRELVEKFILPHAGSGVDTLLNAMQVAVQARATTAAKLARGRCEQLLQTDSKPSSPSLVPQTAEDVARFIGRHYYTWYELYDSMLFPIIHGSEVGEEIAPVEPVRISPLTGRDEAGLSAGNPKLMPSGTAAGHFGAFLHAQWRTRDILIGRMNAAEKLIRTAVTGTPHDTPEVIDRFIAEAHGAILEEEHRRRDSIIGKWLDTIHAVTTPEARLAQVTESGIPAEELPGQKAAEWIARSAKVLGRVFREATERPAVKRLAAALLFTGQLLTGMVEVLVPRRWFEHVLRLWIPRLLVFAVSLIVLGPLLSKEQVTSLGWTTFWLVVGFLVLTVALRSVLNKRWSMVVRVGTALVALATMVLLAVGVLYLPDAVRDVWQRVTHRMGP